MTTSTPIRLPAGWTSALPHDRCNYHRDRPALAVYVGTPMCNRCVDRIKPELAEELQAA